MHGRAIKDPPKTQKLVFVRLFLQKTFQILQISPKHPENGAKSYGRSWNRNLWKWKFQFFSRASKVNFCDERVTKIWNSVWSTLLPVSKRFSSGISCLLSGNIWFAGGITWDDSNKVARIPKNRRKWVCFHDKKSLLLFLRGRKRAKTAKIGKTKFFTQSSTLKTLGKCSKNNCRF